MGALAIREKAEKCNEFGQCWLECWCSYHNHFNRNFFWALNYRIDFSKSYIYIYICRWHNIHGVTIYFTSVRRSMTLAPAPNMLLIDAIILAICCYELLKSVKRRILTLLKTEWKKNGEIKRKLNLCFSI